MEFSIRDNCHQAVTQVRVAELAEVRVDTVILLASQLEVTAHSLI